MGEHVECAVCGYDSRVSWLLSTFWWVEIGGERLCVRCCAWMLRTLRELGWR